MSVAGTVGLRALALAAALSVFTLGLPSADASLIVEDFTYTSGAQLLRLRGGSGWQDNAQGANSTNSWGASTGGSGNSARIVIDPGNLTYSTGGYAITQTGTGYAVGNYIGFRGINRYTAQDLTGTIWFSILLRNEVTADHAGLQFNNHADPYAGTDYDRGGFDVGLHGTSLIVHYGGADSASLATLAVGATHLLIGRWDVGAGNDTLSLWADPANLAAGPGGLGTPLFTQNNADLGANLFLAGVYSWGASSTTTSRGGRMDALRIADGLTGFTDVAGVPEPGTLALTLLGLAAVSRRLRRKR